MNDRDASATALQDTAVDALSLLRQDHRDLRELFALYRAGCSEGADDHARRVLVERICTLLSLHAQVEEELFYPAARAAIERDDLLDEAEVEHALVDELIEQIRTMDADEPLYDAKVRVLGELVVRHVEKEENDLFSLVETSTLDVHELGAELQVRRRELETDD